MGPVTYDRYRACSGYLSFLCHFQAHSLCPQVLCPGPASHLHRREAHSGCFDLAHSKAEGEWLFPQFWDAPEQCHEGNVCLVGSTWALSGWNLTLSHSGTNRTLSALGVWGGGGVKYLSYHRSRKKPAAASEGLSRGRRLGRVCHCRT